MTPPSFDMKSTVLDAKELAKIHQVVDVVCEELGIQLSDRVGRERIAHHMRRSWELGRRTPLGLVQAGLDSANSSCQVSSMEQP